MTVDFTTLRLTEGTPIYQQIIAHLQAGIAAGTVQDGDALPSRRTLSALLGINPNTIQKAFRQLEDEGWIRSHPGAKSVVSVTAAQVEALRQQLPHQSARAFVRQMQSLGLDCAATVSLIQRLWREEEQP